MLQQNLLYFQNMNIHEMNRFVAGLRGSIAHWQAPSNSSQTEHVLEGALRCGQLFYTGEEADVIQKVKESVNLDRTTH